MKGPKNLTPLITYDVKNKDSKDSNNLLKGSITFYAFYVPNTCYGYFTYFPFLPKCYVTGVVGVSQVLDVLTMM